MSSRLGAHTLATGRVKSNPSKQVADEVNRAVEVPLAFATPLARKEARKWREDVSTRIFTFCPFSCLDPPDLLVYSGRSAECFTKFFFVFRPGLRCSTLFVYHTTTESV
ncbi:hypothetical protein Bbelb_174530 [Branchiostoma belcheri]|nr:hypothetical protein Bbelb_174530 [Branchiostoma belcheri]